MPAILGRLEFWVVFLPNMLWMGTQFAVLTWLPRYARDILAMPDAAVGILPALVPLGQIAGSTGFGWLHARRPRLGLPIFFGTAVLYVVAMALLAGGRRDRRRAGLAVRPRDRDGLPLRQLLHLDRLGVGRGRA